MKVDPNMAPPLFWEQHYGKTTSETSGRPSAVLKRFVENRATGTALELGCGRGDDAIWLASKGWQVTAVDISKTALDYARANAKRSNVRSKIDFRTCDLVTDFPDGDYDLVSALFLESPVTFPREAVLKQAAAAVRSGGMLLIAAHGPMPHSSAHSQNRVFLSPRQSLNQLDLDPAKWREVFVDTIDRPGTGPDGQAMDLTDTVIVLERI